MIDLNLFATLLRAINWNSVQRLILIGDPNQLPPIGRGRVFADTIAWLKAEYPENVGVLTDNIRQLVNRVDGNGNGILELANIFMLIAIRSSTWKSERWNLILPKNGMEVNSSEKVL
ncbi:AAA family ATPase [Oribacterium sp. oral taxon 078]|uniref:AAA family ATPase n=1 Tax=Oribacterium sp. oral taxon 078 TaxID=652706 RepID=UPI001A98093D|nr:AAA family ATPase [Oribacterium sp. oral taxon 078]